MIKDKFSNKLLIILFFISFSSLSIEVTLTRLFSSLFVHNYVYLIISLCISGLGVGSLLLFFIPQKKINIFLFVLFFTQIALSFLLFVFNTILINLFINLIFSFLLFVIAGFIITFVYKNNNTTIGKIYFVDLVGGAIGIILSFFIINLIGSIHTLIFINIFFAIILLFFIKNIVNLSLKKSAIFLLAILPLVIGSFIFNNKNITPIKNNKKEISWLINRRQAKIIKTQSNSFGRCDLIDTNDIFTKIMYVDGSGGSFMIKWDEEAHKNKALIQTLKYKYPAGLPINAFTMNNKQNALIIGSGGGIDVTLLLANNFSSIYAAEINPTFIKFVKEYSDFNGGIYTNNSKVKLFNVEGRSFVQKSNKLFDLILISKPLIESARGINSYALMENRLLTTEAFNDYRKKLNDKGYFLTVTYFLPHLIKLTVNALYAMNKDGLSDKEALNHLILVMRKESPLLIMKKEQFNKEESSLFKHIFDKHIPNILVYYPFFSINKNNPILKNTNDDTKKFITILNTKNKDVPLYKRLTKEYSSKYNMNYTTDNNPYFFNITKGIPSPILILFFVSIGIIILVYLLFFNISKINNSHNIKYFILFSILGLAFVMVENSILYKLSTFWNQKMILLVIVLSTILISSGIGGFISTKIKNTKLKWMLVSLFIPIYTIILFIFGEKIITVTQHTNILLRILTTILIIFPLFFSMGLPFPSLLKNISHQSNNKIFPWLLGINSMTTMLAGVLTTILSIKKGFSIVLLLGGLAYFIFIIQLFFNKKMIKKG